MRAVSAIIKRIGVIHPMTVLYTFCFNFEFIVLASFFEKQAIITDIFKNNDNDRYLKNMRISNSESFNYTQRILIIFQWGI